MPQDIEAKLQAALQRYCGDGCRLAQCRRLSAGASAETYALDVESPQGMQALILRRSAGGQGLGVNVDKRTEALVQRAAAAAGVPAPAVLFILEPDDGLGEGYVMRRGAGETLPKRILGNAEFATARAQLTRQCAQALAAIHAVPVASLPKLAALPAGPQLKQIEALYRSSPLVSPVFELALRWLGQRLPGDEAPLALVHGDFRNGNLLVDAQGLRLVLDWELTHLGDPMEDLGWLCVNAWRFGRRDQPVGGFGERSELYATYEAASGRAVDAPRVRFWEVFGTLKWGVICLLQAMLHLSGTVRSVERAAIGRRIPETELDLLDLIESKH
jgi:aminoglycoside phosphotransferase (APT) family kinase protein